MNNPETPLLSVVVAIVSDTTTGRSNVSPLLGCLEALSQQIDPPSLEIIVPFHAYVDNIDQAKQQFPTVQFICVDDLQTLTGRGGSREHHDELRARGLAAAQGTIIGLLEDHARPDPHWCARVVKAHAESDAAAIGGAIENGVDRLLNWAVYFCDFGKYQNPVRAGESPFASDANITYKRSALEAVQPVWRDSFHETAVNWALRSQGEKLILSPEIIVYQNRQHLTLLEAIQERFIWGRSYAATRSALIGFKRLIYALLSPAIPLVLLSRMTGNAIQKKRFLGVFLKALPFTALLTVSWAWGEFVGYATGRTHGRPNQATGETVAQAQHH